MTEMIGWLSSGILLLTISWQIHRQWQSGSSEGVSKWLFIGQLSASLGFSVYSYLLKNWVFVVTNLLMALSAIAGVGVVWYHRRKKGGGERAGCNRA
jgi:uncharacterized protein with PQ loop repeat